MRFLEIRLPDILFDIREACRPGSCRHLPPYISVKNAVNGYSYVPRRAKIPLLVAFIESSICPSFTNDAIAKDKHNTLTAIFFQIGTFSPIPEWLLMVDD